MRLRPLRVVTALATVVVVAGCGATRPVSEHPGVANGPSPKVSSSLRAQEAAIHRQVLASLHDDRAKNARYGDPPAYLRSKQAAPADQVLTATAAHPVFAIQGNSVRLRLADGSALATAVGPQIPQRIQGSADLHTRATWVLTFAHVRGTVPLSPKLFTVTDEQGALLLPRVSVAGGGPLPRNVPAGRPFTLRLTAVVSVGDGKLRYAPEGGPWLAEWDFDVETD